MSAAHHLPSEDLNEGTARIDAEKVAEKLDNYDEVIDAAKEADRVDHELGILKALKRNKKAVLWSMFLSTALVMEGFQLVIINSFYGQEQFLRRYGKVGPDGKYYIPASWQSGLSNGSLCGQIIGLGINGYVSQRIGYRKTMMCALSFLACVIFCVFFAPSLEVLLVGEMLCGLSWGVFQTLTTAYAADILPIALRPLLTSYINMCWGMGILLSSAVARAALELHGSTAYRLPFGLQWIWPGPLLVGTFLCPESPPWLVRNGRTEQAKRSLRRLSAPTVTNSEIDQQLALIRHTDAVERAETEGATFLDCFKTTNLRRTEIGMAIFAMQNLSGGPMIGFAVTFLQQAGMSQYSAFDFNVGITTMYTAGTIISWFFLHRVGRRTIYIYGLAGMAIVCGIIGVIGFLPNTKHANLAVGILLIFLNLMYNVSIGPVCYCIVAEISSTRLRPLSVVLSRVAYNCAGLVTNAITPRMIQPTSWGWGARSGIFWMGLATLCMIYCIVRLPETRGRSFGELDVLFERKIAARKFSSTKIDLFVHTAAGVQKDEHFKIANDEKKSDHDSDNDKQ